MTLRTRQREKGQGDQVTVILTIIAAGIALFVGVQIFDDISNNVEKTYNKDYSTNEREFGTVNDWTIENTGALKVEHTGENIRLYSTDAENGAGTVTISQELEISDIGIGITTATMETIWFIENADNFQAENTYLRLRDPNNNIDAELFGSDDTPAVSTSWEENSVDITDNIDEEGTWTLELFFESQDNGAGVNAYVDNSQLRATSEIRTESHKISDDLKDAYALTPVIVIVLVASAILGVLYKFKS